MGPLFLNHGCHQYGSIKFMVISLCCCNVCVTDLREIHCQGVAVQAKTLCPTSSFSLLASDELVARSGCSPALNLARWRIFCAVAMTVNIVCDISVCSHAGISWCVAKGEYLMLHHLAANPFWSSASPLVQQCCFSFLLWLLTLFLPLSDCFESVKYFATLHEHLWLPSPQLKSEGCLCSPLSWALPLHGRFVGSCVGKRLVKYFYKKKWDAIQTSFSRTA